VSAIQKQLAGMIAIPSQLQAGVTEFVPKDEFEFRKITERADSILNGRKNGDGSLFSLKISSRESV